MQLTDLMDPRLVELELTAGSPEETIAILVDLMVAAGVLERRDDALRRLVEREKVMSTGIGGGVAIPHARSPELDRTLLVIARSRPGVPFNAVDAAPVHCIFLILGPADSSAEHVRVLGRIARIVRQPEFLSDLQAAGTAADVVELVRRCD